MLAKLPGFLGCGELHGLKRLAIVTFFRSTHIRVYPDGSERRRNRQRPRKLYLKRLTLDRDGNRGRRQDHAAVRVRSPGRDWK